MIDHEPPGKCRASDVSLLRAHPVQGGANVAILLAAAGLFLAGIFRPFTSVTKLWLFENEVSVYQGLFILWDEEEYFLASVLFTFTLVFPLVKIGVMLVLWAWPKLGIDAADRVFWWVANLGKWSMLDVFVVAVLVLIVRSGGVASITIREGCVLFFCSVVLTQIASMWTGRLLNH